MPKKTTFLILILALVTGVLLFLAVSENQKPPSTQNAPLPAKKVVQKTAKVFFSPQNLDLSEGTASPTSTVDLMVDTGTNEISGVQIEAQYDPKALASVKLIPGLDENSFFGPPAAVLFSDINQQTGRISYAIAIGAGQKAKRGVGKIATISFQKAYNTTAPTTTITLLDKTLVTILGENESVLKEALPLNITLSQQNTQTQISPATSPVQNFNY